VPAAPAAAPRALPTTSLAPLPRHPTARPSLPPRSGADSPLKPGAPPAGAPAPGAAGAPSAAPEAAAPALVVNGKPFHLVNSALMLLKMLDDYMALYDIVPQFGAEIVHRELELLKQFNSQVGV
jgi:hypothetical protein